MAKFTKGQFIRWTSKDNEGTFSHVGQVISHKNGVIVFADANGGKMGVPDTDGKFEVAKKPRTWGAKIGGAKRKVKATSTAHKPVKQKRVRAKGGETKLDQVIALLRNDPPASRKDAIAKIVEAGITTAAGASTYYNSAKKVL